jgi:AAT family amino acid transporter
MLTLFYYTILVVPFWGLIYGVLFGKSYGLGIPWWGGIAGTMQVHWVFGWWEWAIILLFMTPNVWRMKPWSLIKLPQPWKGFISLNGPSMFMNTKGLGCAILPRGLC